MKAVLVFVEGRHDVVFVTRSLGAAGGKWVDKPIKDLPAPFGSQGMSSKSVIVRHYESRAMGNIKLPSAKHAPLPVFDAIVEMTDQLFVVLRMGSDSKSKAATKLLGDIRSQVAFFKDSPGPVDIDDIASAFIFDADSEGVEARQSKFTKDFSTILPNSRNIEHGRWVSGPMGPVGLFVFHDAQMKTGTLEDILAPMVKGQWPDRWAGADRYLSRFIQPGDPIDGKSARRLKAQINITGQFLCPGDPMSQVIGKNGLGSEHFQGHVSGDLATFLRTVPW